ncbi:hypothetical protein, partial [Bradyrhizobium sp. 33ap4]|uniref:hypothetical protein n=1 Tax=Bradyrhizobium sp. 33ap4 TaxID=3061630 RepID=UPI00292F4B45
GIFSQGQFIFTGVLWCTLCEEFSAFVHSPCTSSRYSGAPSSAVVPPFKQGYSVHFLDYGHKFLDMRAAGLHLFLEAPVPG